VKRLSPFFVILAILAVTFVFTHNMTDMSSSQTATAQVTDGSRFLIYEAVGTESISIDTSAVKTFDTTLYSSTAGTMTQKAFLTVETADIRYWHNGSVPTTSLGHKLASGNSLEVIGNPNIRNFKAISASGTATVFVTYSKLAAGRR